METLFRLNLKELLEKSMDEGYSKDVTIAAAHLLRSFYWKIGPQDAQDENYWLIRTNLPVYNQTVARLRIRSFPFDYFLRNSLASLSDANNQFAFTIWRNNYEGCNRGTGMSQWPHTFWLCENREVSYSKLIRGMVRTCLVRQVYQAISKFVIAQKGSKIGFFVQNNNSAEHPISQQSVTTLTPEDRLEMERGETEPIGMHWNRFIPFHPFAQNGATNTVSDCIMLLPVHPIKFFQENLQDTEKEKEKKVEFVPLPESWIEENYYLIGTEPDEVNMTPPIYCGVFWDIQDERHFPYIEHIFKVISTSEPPVEIYCEKISQDSIREVLVTSKSAYRNRRTATNLHNLLHVNTGLSHSLARFTVPESFAETVT